MQQALRASIEKLADEWIRERLLTNLRVHADIERDGTKITFETVEPEIAVNSAAGSRD